MALIKGLRSTGVVSSGSGQPVTRTTDRPLIEYSLENLSRDNAPQANTTTVLTSTRRANISKDQLNQADRNYTTALNQLSQFWANQDTSSPDYEAAKLNALQAQRRWELARDGLEEVVTEDKGDRRERDAQRRIDFISQEGGNPISPDAPAVPTGEVIPPDGTEPEPADLDGDGAPGITVTPRTYDPRIRIRAKSGASGARPDEGSFYGIEGDIMFPLVETNGVIFPYTPTIQMSHAAQYESMAPTHANTDYRIYRHTPAIQISIEGTFTAQNIKEAQYLLAAQHFFRTVTKMRFGINDPDRGLPPPVLLLSGYGTQVFNDLNVIVTDFSMGMPSDVDYIELNSDGGMAWVPSLTTFSVSLVVQHTPQQQREFEYQKFASGELLSEKGWL